MSELPREAEGFLRDLERHLSPLPAIERQDIVAEIRTHLADRAAQGAGNLLASFGHPDEYAATFLEQRALSDALARGSSWALGRALLAGARRLGWWYAVLALGLVQVLGATLLALSVIKLLFPGEVGVFVGGHGLTIGTIGGDRSMVEVLGWWAVPVFLCLGVAALWSANWMLRLLAGWRLARLRPSLRA
jgi:uncharacterized membrane protein